MPQTSTIASQLPKAVGAAMAIARRTALGVAPAASADVPDDAIALVSFGDASLNHASALTAINAARWAHRRSVLVVDECRATGGGIADAVVASLAESAGGSLRGRVGTRAPGG